MNGEKSDGDTQGTHGTCMLSKIVGQDYGISKATKVTIVRLPQGVPSAQEAAAANGQPFVNHFRALVFADALMKIGIDVVNKGLQFKSVINLSLGAPDTTATIPTPGHPAWALYNICNELIKAGVVIVTSAGNDGWIFNDQVRYTIQRNLSW